MAKSGIIARWLYAPPQVTPAQFCLGGNFGSLHSAFATHQREVVEIHVIRPTPSVSTCTELSDLVCFVVRFRSFFLSKK